MPEPEQQTAPTAGISPPEQVDVAALFARLKEEVRHASGLDVSNGFNRGVVRTRLRTVAERFWPVTAERPLGRRLGELEERLTRVERRPAAGGVPVAATVAAQPAAAALPDYFAFESRMRGQTDVIRERQRAYLDDFRDAAPVADLGCGRGEFL